MPADLNRGIRGREDSGRRQQLVQQAAQGVEIASRARWIPDRDLRSHVRRRARCFPGPGDPRELRRSMAVARPKSRTFTVPSELSITFAGLRSR